MPLHLPTNSDSLSLKGLNQSSDFLSASSVPFCPTTHTAARHQMPLLAVAPLVSLFFFSGFAIAAVQFPACSSTTWEWVCSYHFYITFLGPYLIQWHFVFVQTYNSLGQNACAVRAFMMATCNGGCEPFFLRWRALMFDIFPAYTIDPLSPGDHYLGPSAEAAYNLCKCSTIGYSLISACGACQGADW